jgi:hypothetical protein
MPVSRVPHSILFYSATKLVILSILLPAGKSQDALVNDLPARIANVWASIVSMLMQPTKDPTLLGRW